MYLHNIYSRGAQKIES